MCLKWSKIPSARGETHIGPWVTKDRKSIFPRKYYLPSVYDKQNTKQFLLLRIPKKYFTVTKIGAKKRKLLRRKSKFIGGLHVMIETTRP